MSKPRYPWWGYAKAMVRQYPELKKEYEQLHEQAITANLSSIPGGGNASRKVEDIVSRELTGSKQIEYEAVRRAIEATRAMRTGRDRLKLVENAYWRQKQSLSLQGAAMAVNISYDTAIDYHGDFIMMVAYFRRLIAYSELKERQKIALKSQKNVLR